ncbi:MAG: glycosyltransferase [Candidatus Marinimicrobia bacterium]|nr:glycosyltransferase [Candidatus Neomarinimicrobiota bacterium]
MRGTRQYPGLQDPEFRALFPVQEFFRDKKDQTIPVGVLAQKDLSFRKKIAKCIRLNLIIPDAKKWWKLTAVKAGCKIIRDEKPDLIFSSSPPPSVHLIARKLAKKNHIPWVADLRDPWSKIHYYYKNRSGITSWLDAALERRTLSDARRVVTVSKNFGDLIECDKNKLELIPNGYDPADLENVGTEHKNNAQFVIAYVGGLNENRYYPEFFRGLRQFAEEKKLKRTDIKLCLAGKIQEKYINDIRDILSSKVLLDIKGYVPHRDAIKVMRTSDLLLLFMEKARNYSGHIPGKLFEYLATGNYILGTGSKRGSAAEILQKGCAGRILGKEDDHKSAIADIYKKWKDGTLRGADAAFAEKFSRKKLTGRLAEVFRDEQ